MQKIVTLNRDCQVRRVPTGEVAILNKNEFVSITQSMGGNYTVTWQGNMYRIDGCDADAIGQESVHIDFDDDGSGKINTDQIWKALDTIYDPEIAISLVQLGLIYNVDVIPESNEVVVKMTLTAPGCGMGPVLIGDVESRLLRVPNVKKVHVEIVFDPPWHKDMMSLDAQLESGLTF